MKNKIFIAAEIFPPDIGGPATYSLKLAEELVKRDFKIKLICYSDKKHKDNYNFKVVRVKRSRFKIWHYIKYLLKLFFLAKDYKLIYAQGPVSSGLPAIVVSWILRKKMIVKVVGDYAWERATDFERLKNISLKEIVLVDEFQKTKPKGRIGWLNKIERFVCKKANKIIVPSRYLKEIVMGWGVPQEKINVIYNSFKPLVIDLPDRDELRSQFKINKKDFLIVSIGRPVVWKDFGKVFLAVHSLIREKGLNLRLRLLGINQEQLSQFQGVRLLKMIKLKDDKALLEKYPIRGSDKMAIVALADDLSNKELKREISKTAIGKQDYQVVLKFLKSADLFILNSGYEGLPHAVLEAITMDVPVAISNTGGNPELVQNNYNGLLFEYNNIEEIKQAILKLYHNPELREEFVRNSKEVLKKFTFEKMINETIKVLLNNYEN